MHDNCYWMLVSARHLIIFAEIEPYLLAERDTDYQTDIKCKPILVTNSVTDAQNIDTIKSSK